ncbi:MAG TPA: DUF3500 domain-containing protein [Blastocatellia bacterium]|nr:DUF3500 domain-containing protein [Blastocatellia bacterium]
MKIKVLSASIVLLALAIGISGSARQSSAAITKAAQQFLASLTAEQRSKALMEFNDEERFNWFYVPRARRGIPLKELDERQRQLAHDFLKATLSQRGYYKATTIMQIELVLREIESPTPGDPATAARRDPALYYFSFFGQPSDKGPWGWRIEGHHLSLNFTAINGRVAATTPTFFGSNPAEVRQGPRRGLRVLGVEEDIARELLHTFSDAERAKVIFQTNAFADIITTNAKRVDPLAPVGVPASRFTPQQMSLLVRLLEEYANSMPTDLAAQRMEKVRRAGLEKIWFGWAGGTERGQPHYYRVQGPTFVIEYDNTQNDANHVHSVWRDFNGDYGRDLLREHYLNAPHHHSH